MSTHTHTHRGGGLPHCERTKENASSSSPKKLGAKLEQGKKRLAVREPLQEQSATERRLREGEGYEANDTAGRREAPIY
jgi:hypothetical protein